MLFPAGTLLEKAFLRFGMPVAVVDLESTGGNLYEDRVTEVALVKFGQGRAERYEWLVNPQKPIPKFVAELTGISDGMVADAPVFAEIAERVVFGIEGVRAGGAQQPFRLYVFKA